jgi:hypothetical protein
MLFEEQTVVSKAYKDPSKIRFLLLFDMIEKAISSMSESSRKLFVVRE